MTAIRKRVTSIVQFRGPATNQQEFTVAKELVPIKEELYDEEIAKDPKRLAEALLRTQKHVIEATRGALSLPVLGGVYWPDVVFSSFVPQDFAHGCEVGLPVSFIVCRPRPNTAGQQLIPGEVSQNTALGRIRLESGVNGTCDLWFFPQPKALR